MRRFALWAMSIALLAAAGVARVGFAQNADDAQPAARPSEVANRLPATAADLPELLERLSHEDSRVREAATHAIVALGVEVAPRLREAFADASDPEVRHRLRYILENIEPPTRAVVVARANPGFGLEPGDVITHLNGRRVSSQAELRQRLVDADRGGILRVRGTAGPREVGPVRVADLRTICDYAAPRGESIAEAITLYAEGYAERANELLSEIPGTIPEGELPDPLWARIAHTAGDGSRARTLLLGREQLVTPSGAVWSSASYLDLIGPGPAPYHLEWLLFAEGGAEVYRTRDDQDLRVQRILVPAQRFAEALEDVSLTWWVDFHGQPIDAQRSVHVAGNLLAVASWMLSELELRSESCRLIEPRSRILRTSERGIRKWVRVDTDAWLALLAGDAKTAVDGFYEDALHILQSPPDEHDPYIAIQNPRIAARVAFFLYQLPDDPRVDEMIGVIGQSGHPALTTYLDWMLLALGERNLREIREHLQLRLPDVPDAEGLPYARAVALLEYVQSEPDLEILRIARQRVFATPPGDERDAWLAIVDALIALARGDSDTVLDVLAPFADRAEVQGLLHTARFLHEPPVEARDHEGLRRPLLAVPIGKVARQWIILSRDRRLMRFDADAGLLTALPRPTASWFPNPLCWPWVSRENASGRTWAYGRRRVIEFDSPAIDTPLRLNLKTDEIAEFDRLIGPRFDEFADLLGGVEPGDREDSEFLRAELRDHTELFADPDLPEIGVIRALPRDPRVIHVALRGGPHILIDQRTNRAWTSAWMRARLNLEDQPEFFAQALPPADNNAAPVVFLMSDLGLLRFDLGAEKLERIALPGDGPYPPLIPESTPYFRRDARFVYVARLPEDGGAVFRLHVADGVVEPLDMINEALPDHYYAILPRSEIRDRIRRGFAEERLPPLAEFFAEVEAQVEHWTQEP